MYTITINGKSFTGEMDDMLRGIIKSNVKFFPRALELYLSSQDEIAGKFIFEFASLNLLLGTKNEALYSFILEHKNDSDFKSEMKKAIDPTIQQVYWSLIGQHNTDDLIDFLLQ